MKNLYIFLLLLVEVGVFGQTSPIEEVKYSPNGYFEKVFDHYGNSYQLKDLQAGADVKVGNTTFKSTSSVCNSGIFLLYFEDNWFGNSATTAVQEARKAVICQVFQDLSNFIVTPLKNTGNTTKVRIWVRNIANIPSVPSNALGLATSFYSMPFNTTANFGGIVDNEVWKTITLGSDSYINIAPPVVNNGPNASGNIYHGMLALNFNTIAWNTNLAINSPVGQYDLYSVILHEVTHALGFASLLNGNGASAFNNNGYKYFSRYDALLKNFAGTQSLITNAGSCSSMYNYQFNSSLSSSILSPNTSSCTTDQTTCGSEIKFFGPSTTTSVYNPNCFEPGSSLSHFEDQCIAPPNQGNNSYFVMSNIQSNGSLPNTVNTKRFLKPEERSALADIGYRLNTTYGNNSIVLNSFKNYGGSITLGNTVAGRNDGIDNLGFYQYVCNVIGNPNSQIQINNILSNDITSNLSNLRFECLEDIYNPTTTNLSVTNGNASTAITFSSSVAGLHLLRYVPYDIVSGKRGNITYIYVYVVNDNNCFIPSSCNLVNNGNMEENGGVIPSNTGQLPLACGWNSVSSTCSTDYFHRNSTVNSVKVPCNFKGSQADNQNLDAYGGMIIWRNYIGGSTPYYESVRVRLGSPLQPNTNYQLSFNVSLAEGGSANAIKFQAYLSNSLYVGSTIIGSTTLPTYGQIPITNNNMLFFKPTHSTVSNGWETLIFDFTTGNVAGEEYLYLGGLSNVDFAQNPVAPVVSGCGYSNNENIPPSSTNGYSYYYFDNVSLIPLNGGSFDLPNQICNYVFLANLTHFLQAIPTNGVFSGNGVSLINGIYTFNASSVSLGNHIITYTYINNNGCSVKIYDTIQVVNDQIIPEFKPIAPICQGGSIVLPTTSVNFIDGSWSPAVNNTTTTTYTFTPNVNQCGAVTSTLTVEVLPANDPSCNSNPCLSDLTLSTPESNSTIVYKRENWIKANSNYEVDGNNVTMKAGDYIVFETDAHLKAGSEVTALIETCTATSKMSSIKGIEKTVLEEEAKLSDSILVFPNPTTDRLTIASGNATMTSVIITAMDGKIIYSNQTVNKTILELDTSSYQGGIYMVSITTTNGTGFVKKLVKN